MTRTSSVDHCDCETTRSRGRLWLEVIVMAVLILAVTSLLKSAGFFPNATLATDTVGLGAIALIGLVAATSSCLALVGGLLLSVSAAWCAAHPRHSRWERFRPLFAFNMGRLISYFLLGGLIGQIGAAFRLSSHITGFVTVILSLIMLILGLRILNLLPKKYCTIPLPASLSRKLRSLSDSGSLSMAMLLGAATFFVPCGFTQSVQLIALASGSFLKGALIMSAFAIGTLPSLLGISLLSSFVQGKSARWFLLFSGTLVLLLGFGNLQGGLLLLGIDVREPMEHLLSFMPLKEHTDDPFVTIDSKGRQIVSLYVTDQGYVPNSFTIEAGKTTWIYALAQNDISGCANFLLAPSYNMQTQIHKGDNWLGPIENPKKDFVLTCSMGMLRANVHVRKS